MMRVRLISIVIYLILWAIANVWISGYWTVIRRGEHETLVCVGEVINIDSSEEIDQILSVMITTGPLRGYAVKVNNKFLGRSFADIVAHVGDKFFLNIPLQLPIHRVSDPTKIEYKSISLGSYFRTRFIMNILGIFGFLLMLFGEKGIRAISALVLSGGALIFLLIPALVRGVPPVPFSLLITAGITLTTFIIVGGINRKSLAGTLGALGGLLMCLVLASISTKVLHLTGLDVEFGFMKLGTVLWRDQVMAGHTWNFSGILLSGIMIGAVGAMMDVCMAISSSIYEIRRANPDLGVTDAIRSGLNVGRDIMGTVTNTLIFAMIGSDLSLFILPGLSFPNAGRIYPLMRLINRESVTVEAIQGLAGTIGLVMAIPITAVIAGLLMASHSRKRATEARSEI